MILTEKQIDTLKEVGNVGAGHAATVLSQIVGSKVSIGISQVSQISAEAFRRLQNSKKNKDISVYAKVSGDVEGGILLKSDISDLKKSANGVIAPYLTAVSQMVHRSLLPVSPEFSWTNIQRVLDNLAKETPKKPRRFVCIETAFAGASNSVKGSFALILQENSMETILKTLEN